MDNYDPQAAGADCEHCPLRGRTVVPPNGSPDADFVIVGEAPGLQEEKRGAPFVGPSGLMLEDLLKAAGIDKRKVFLTNTLLCRSDTPGVSGQKRYDLKTYLAWLRKENARRKKLKEPLVKSPLECCKPRLWAELSWFEQRAREKRHPNGQVVIPVGNYAAWAVTGRLGIMKLRGSPIPLGGAS